MHANASKFRVDTRRIFLIGQSAGGHMVSLAATLGDGPWPRTGGWEEADNSVAGVISVAAAYDLPSLDWGDIWSPLETFAYSGPGEPHAVVRQPAPDPAEARRLASQSRHVTADIPPLLVLHSSTDHSVPIANVTPFNPCFLSPFLSREHLFGSDQNISVGPQCEVFLKELEAKGAAFEFEDWEEEGHMQITDKVIARALRWMHERWGLLP